MQNPYAQFPNSSGANLYQQSYSPTVFTNVTNESVYVPVLPPEPEKPETNEGWLERELNEVCQLALA